MAGDPLIELRDVNKYFGDPHVLRDTNLTVAKGEVVVVIGPSGSGKSALCRAVNRLETIQSGAIPLDGQPLPEEGKGLARLRAEVGMVFQSFTSSPAGRSCKSSRRAGSASAGASGRTPTSAPVNSSTGPVRATGRTSIPPSSPAAGSSVSPSPGPSPWSARRCCSTSPPPRSTPR
ncbi:putative Fe(3+)-transporting ATPase [Streptomyces viridochromogenes Tue57]|uniref:Putative Fe(3+)-transporting ATPase n=1 Tax=Streptomyces viridochromogenes Tue57 TaxID=1160705 RepID=L8PMH8_STRVR|nr:putative Fe(3+)-transporting ATPase [Streptomyces viridochromogenes Tue57]